MKRLEEKVKDIVDVRAFAPLVDLSADPAKTLAGYRFTDITSDLMAKWVERVSVLNRGVGAASALAGFRGVGKSHFLAAIAAILSRPDLRPQITEAHVRSAAEALPRRPFMVAIVQRGSETTLLDELKTAAARATDLARKDLGDSVSEVLHKCSLRAGDLPFVLIFDTMPGREKRVAREDGALLSEIAEVGKSMGMFVGVALDDDISDADGANMSIAGSFVIDYLDQEHLFKIVDTHIFAKDGAKLPLLRDIYGEWRQALPAFRWSEQRFLSLYPMHPATLEVAPLIRLYIQDFALLGFASEAGVKILGRPANSLIGLDEMFDNIESRLRQIAELKPVFETFDRVERDVISKAPVGVRLASKLLLKGLFLLSMGGQGVSADDIAAGMMILPSDGRINVEEVLRSFEPAGVVESEGRFSMTGAAVASETGANSLEQAARAVSDAAIWDLLLRITSEKFSDLEASDELGQSSSLCTVEWRGALRRGVVVWRGADPPSETFDWTIVVERREAPRVDLHAGRPTLLWRIAPLTEQEKDTFRRYHVLRSDQKVREELGEGLATALQIHSISCERIWQRAFLQAAKLLSANGEYPVYDEGTGAHTLAQLLSNALSPYFEMLYPDHPLFGGSLGIRESTLLVSNFFGAAAPESAETKKLVDAFVAPLGLGVSFDSSVIPTPGDELEGLAVVRAAIGDDAGQITLKEVASRLGASPLGLTREAQHLVLAALVAQKRFDFVTASGNRINHRSLDLQIIWDDIVAIGPPQTEEYPIERLLSWAKVLTGIQHLTSIDRGDDRRQILDSLRQWISDWEADNTLAKFDALPEEQLNTRVWRLASGLKRTFGSAASAIESLLKDEITLVECLRSIAVLFSDSEADYEMKIEDLAVLNKYVLVSARRGPMLIYVAAADWTSDETIDGLRRELLGLLTGGGIALNGENDRIDELWKAYVKAYAERYTQKHSEAEQISADGDRLREIRGSEMWNTFQLVRDLPFVSEDRRREVGELMRTAEWAGCDNDVPKLLLERPICRCGYRLCDLEAYSELPARLARGVEDSIGDLREGMLANIGAIVDGGRRARPGSNIEDLLHRVADQSSFPRLGASDILLLKAACETSSALGPLPAVDALELELLSLEDHL